MKKNPHFNAQQDNNDFRRAAAMVDIWEDKKGAALAVAMGGLNSIVVQLEYSAGLSVVERDLLRRDMANIAQQARALLNKLGEMVQP